MAINELLEISVKKTASDLHIKAGLPPLLRIYGELEPLEGRKPFSKEDAKRLCYSIISDEQQKKFEENLALDIGYEFPPIGRFRIHMFVQREGIGMVVRAIPYKIPSFKEIGLPEQCVEFCKKPRGLVLVTGVAGCGKTTTQAAMIDYINTHYPLHIVSIEDPIEFVHESKMGLVNQRGLDIDTLSFGEALKHVFRQDPDIILIGEMRDLETISLAITAAETGHLVFGTLHTTDTTQTIDRIIDAYPTHQQQQIRLQLTVNLVGVISQVLLKNKTETGRVAAFEVLTAVPAIRNLIREAKTYQIASVLQTGKSSGMISLDQSLANLVKKEIIDYSEGITHAINARTFRELVGRKG